MIQTPDHLRPILSLKNIVVPSIAVSMHEEYDFGEVIVMVDDVS